MSDNSKRAGQASVAVGAGAGLAALNTNRIANARNRRYQSNVDRELNKVKAAYGLDASGNPTAKIDTSSMKRNKGQANPRVRDAQGVNRTAARARAAKIIELGEKRKQVPWTPHTRGKFMRGAALIAVPTSVVGAHYSVDKADVHRRDVDAGLTAAIAGGAAYQGAGYALKPLDRKYERKLAMSDEHRATLRAHKKTTGLPRNAVAGDEHWRKYFRTYPKGLPGSRLKRALAVSHAGPTGAAATVGAGALAGLAASNASAKARYNAQVSKGTNIREFPYLPENIREWQNSAAPIRRNPISPLSMIAASNVMAMGNNLGNQSGMSKRQLRRLARGLNLYEGGRATVYSPIGQGTMI